MMKFSSVEDLVNELRLDYRQAHRFATRLILVHGSDVWGDLVGALHQESDHSIRLSQYCTGSDVFPDLEALQKELHDLPTSSPAQVLVAPLAECLRLSPESGHVLRVLAQWPVGKIKRLYIPLFAAESFLMEELQHVVRYTEGLLPDIWHLEGSGRMDLVVAPFIPEAISRDAVRGIREYMLRWEQGGVRKCWLATSLARWLPGTVSHEARVTVYPSSYELMREASGTTVLHEEWGESSQWDWLTKSVKEHEPFDAVAKRLLNVVDFDPWRVFALWPALDSHHRWLSWLWSKVRVEPGGYLHHVLSQSSRIDSFLEQCVLGIFDSSSPAQWSSERRRLLRLIGSGEKPAAFWDEYQQIRRPIDQLAVLTDLSQAERKELAICTSKLIGQSPPRTWLEDLEDAFPQLAWYLDAPPTGDEFVDRYFAEYRVCRLADEASQRLLQLANEWSQGQRLWSYKGRLPTIEGERSEGARILWVDGMGVEWAGLIASYLAQEKIPYRLEIVRALLPTTTQANAEWQEGEEIVRAVDMIAHHYEYRPHESFIQALRAVQDVVRQASDLLSSHTRVVIAADHGLTRFAGIEQDRLTLPEGSEVLQSGRVAKLLTGNDDNHVATPYVVDAGIACLLTHGLFKGGARHGEMHGGATPEELLIPLFVLYRADAQEMPGYALRTDSVRLNARGECEIIVRFDRIVTRAEMKSVGANCSARQGDGTEWVFMCSGLRSGVHTCRLYAEGAYLGKMEVKTIGGLGEDDLGLEVPRR